MRTRSLIAVAAFAYLVGAVDHGICDDRSAVALPAGVKAVWDLGKAYRETTPTRERICINGLWRWQPAEMKGAQPPTANWGYLKVPGRAGWESERSTGRNADGLSASKLERREGERRRYGLA